MATSQTANVYITNTTDGTAHMQLFHKNTSNGIHNGSWWAAPGATVGPLTVSFETGVGSYGVLDWWSLTMAVRDGSTPGLYQSAGTTLFPNWKECQLQHGDANKTLTFSASTSEFDIALASGGCTDAMTRLGGLASGPGQPATITNVFVLMLENHSFDNIFGQSGIAGITKGAVASNVYQPPGGGTSTTFDVAGDAPDVMSTDPGHEFDDVLEQLCGPGSGSQSGASFTPLGPGGSYPAINMSGFAQNYGTTTSEGPTPDPSDIGDIMLGFDTPTQLPVLYTLATEFALCDHWFSSMPGPTWPNRFFLHGASSAGLDHSPTKLQIGTWETVSGFTYPDGSVYDALSDAGRSYRLYIDDTDAYSDEPGKGSAFGKIPQVSSLKGITLADVNSMTHFASDLQQPYPYAYTFIEPNWGDITGDTYQGGSSQHPTDDMYGGEGLIKAVYEAIRNSPLWDTSMLVVTYDEHGGFFDSVPPGSAPAPNDGSSKPSNPLNASGFDFETYGVRVPAVVVSPWIPKGLVDHTVYDHSSVAATLSHHFGTKEIGRAVQSQVNYLGAGLLTEPTPRTDAPTALPDPAPTVPRSTVAMQPEVVDEQPYVPVGNSPGFLALALKAMVESTDDEEERREALEAFDSISTRGDARRFVARAVARSDAAQAARVTS